MREHGETEIIMNGTGRTHPPVTLDKARGAWGTERALLANGCKKGLSERVQAILPRGPGLQGAEGKVPAHFCWSHLHLPPPPSTFPPASRKAGSLLCSACSLKWKESPAALWRGVPQAGCGRGCSWAMLMATELWHIADELVRHEIPGFPLATALRQRGTSNAFQNDCIAQELMGSATGTGVPPPQLHIPTALGCTPRH